MRLNDEHVDYILHTLKYAQWIERLSQDESDNFDSLEWVIRSINEMEMMLALRHRVQNHTKFDEIIEANFRWRSVK